MMRHFCLLFFFAHSVGATMGPLLNDTTILDTSSGGCVSTPGDCNAVCCDAGAMPDAATCAASCNGVSYCSAVTWHDPTTGEWANHCVQRLDGVFAPRECGTGCGHVSANKSSGWSPRPPPPPPAWAPTVTGYTGFIKPTWFGANSSGVDNDDTLALIARHAVGGYGWQQGGHAGGGSVGTGEELGAQAADNLRSYLNAVGNPNKTVIFVYRQVQVALRLFAQCALAADSPADAPFFLSDPDSGATCLAGQPWGTSDPYWNFTNQDAQQYWINNVIGELATEEALTTGGGSVFFDECDQDACGYRGGSCDFSKFDTAALQTSKIVLLARMVKALNAVNIIPILSLDNRMNASNAGTTAPAPCALPEDDLVEALAGTSWVRFYENWPQSFWTPGGPDLSAANVANAIIEGENGIPVILHAGGACPAPQRNITRPGPLGGDIEFLVATYLIVATPGATLSVSDNWYDANFCWRDDFDVDFGIPAGPAVRTSVYTWERNYTRSTVSLDVHANTGNVMLL